MKKEIYGVATFKSTHHTIQAEGFFKSRDISFKTIPTPREITRSCGLAIVFTLDDLEGVREMIDSSQINIDSLYEYTKSKEGNKAEKIV